MNTIELLLSTETLTVTEQDYLLEVLDNPTVKKYLKSLAKQELSDLISLTVTERDSEEVCRKHALIQGKLSIITTLLSIKNS